MHEHTIALVKLGLDECDGRHEVLEDVRSLSVVYVDLAPDERLFYSMSGPRRSAGGWRRTS